MGVSDPYNIQRFINAQEGTFETALSELKAGSKQSHWMWFIFPQLAGLGRSPTAQHYAIASLDEAQAFLDHPELGRRLRDSVHALLPWASKRSALQIFGPIDELKLRSSLTLFDQVEPDGLMRRALDVFFNGRCDERTLALLAPAR